jgi:hypothetical protein
LPRADTTRCPIAWSSSPTSETCARAGPGARPHERDPRGIDRLLRPGGLGEPHRDVDDAGALGEAAAVGRLLGEPAAPAARPAIGLGADLVEVDALGDALPRVGRGLGPLGVVARDHEEQRVRADRQERRALGGHRLQPPATLVDERGARPQIDQPEPDLRPGRARRERRDDEREVAQRQRGISLEVEIAVAVAADDRGVRRADLRRQAQRARDPLGHRVDRDHHDARHAERHQQPAHLLPRDVEQTLERQPGQLVRDHDAGPAVVGVVALDTAAELDDAGPVGHWDASILLDVDGASRSHS